MSRYSARITWQQRDGDDFTGLRYSRVHRWDFDGGAAIAGSPSPQNVRAPYSDAAAVDPEEALLAAISSCHMLCFLYRAARAGYEVASYDDAAEAVLEATATGATPWMTRAILRPSIRFSGTKIPDDAAVAALHEAAHGDCYIAHSVKTAIEVAGSWEHMLRENGAGGGT